jgi:hypothetical protein
MSHANHAGQYWRHGVAFALAVVRAVSACTTQLAPAYDPVLLDGIRRPRSSNSTVPFRVIHATRSACSSIARTGISASPSGWNPLEPDPAGSCNSMDWLPRRRGFLR